MTMSTIIKENINLTGLQFQSLVHYHHGWEARQCAGRFGAEEVRVIYVHQQATEGDLVPHCAQLENVGDL